MHPYNGTTTGNKKTFARLSRLLLAASLWSVAAGHRVHAFTFIEPGTFTISRAGAGGADRYRPGTEEPHAGRNPGVTLAASGPGGGLRASLGPRQGSMDNAAADDAPSARASVAAMLMFTAFLSALRRRRAPETAGVSSVMESERLGALQNLPRAGTVLQPRVI